MNVCDSCSANLAPGQKFCTSCGKAVQVRVCPQCREPLQADQKFCSNCGASTTNITQKKKSLADLAITEVEAHLGQANSGLVRSVVKLMTQPGQSMRDYLEGKWAKFPRPIIFITLLSAGMIYLYNRLMPRKFADFNAAGERLKQVQSDEFDLAGITDRTLAVTNFVSKHMEVVILASFPVIALLLALAFKSFNRYTVRQWFSITTFLVAQALLIYMISLPIIRFFPGVEPWVYWLMLGFGVWSMIDLFNDQNPLNTGIRAALVGLALKGIIWIVTTAFVIAMITSGMK